MGEDEAFIRAIVDGPGDDLPRLVYADWLDDRGDPRGPYLQAEREAVETGDVARLRELAAGLDPVWVARVSRPPVGVCCDRVGFERRRPRTTSAALAALERRFNLQLSSEYQAFLLNYNAVSSDSALYRTTSGYCYPLLYIFAVNTSDGRAYDGPADELGTTWQIQQLDLAWRLQRIEEGDSWPEWDSPHLRDFAPLLCHDEEPDGESGWLLIGVRGPHVGHIATLGYDSQTNEDTTISIAATLASFFGSLVPANGTVQRRRTRRRLFEQ
jgi:uncharacterized protein (TIGR02996 family)